MTPERWQRAKQIFQSALERAPRERSGYLASACGDDRDLRAEVESLIAAHEKSGEFIDSPAYAAAAEMVIKDTAELKAGQTVSAYEIISFISRGGMGDVYLAQDRRLNRKVALKLLPASFTRDHERLRRFEQEARAASALNHPNIITIFEILKTKTTHAIATEFVDGETLRQRLSHSPLTLSESLHVAIQVADALSAAHQVGIIHRDIKPENIMLRPDGYVKVLDFGLAKLSEEPPSIPPDEAPTRQVRTGSGVVIGTAAYMSPEQARGKQVDVRSDIFSLGAVIYEMVTRDKPFPGETPSDVLAAVLKTDPPLLSQVAPSTPPELTRIVNKALRKDREQRYQSTKDLLIDLKSLKEELDFQSKLNRSASPHKTEEPVIGAQRSLGQAEAKTSEIKTAVSTITHSVGLEIRRHKALTVLAAAVVMAVVAGALFLVYKFIKAGSPQTNEAVQILRNTQITFSGGLAYDPSISPDGNSVAYSSDQSGKFEIYVNQLAPGGREIQLTSNGQQNFLPAWSSDGQRIAYVSRGHGIWIVPALGGVPKQLTEFGSWPAWSRDGAFIAFQSGQENALPPSTIWIVSSGGGVPKQITQPGNPLGGHGTPSWAPDGARIVFAAIDYLSSALWTVGVNGNDLKRIGSLDLRPNPDNGAIYSADGRSIYFSGYAGPHTNYGIVGIRVLPNGDAVGEPKLIMGFPGKGIRHLSITPDGKKLAYASIDILSTLTALPMSPVSNEPAGPPAQLSNDRSQRHVLPTFSPDGKKIAFGQWREGSGADVWLLDPDGKNLTQVTTDPAIDNVPNWFPEGDRLEFISNRSGQFTAWSISLASGKENLLVDLGPGVGGYARMSPDGKQIAFNSVRSGTINVWIKTIDGGEPKQLTFDKEMMGFPCWSPDGKTLAMEVKRGPNDYLAIVPSDGGSPVQLVSDNGLSWPHDWSHDGDKILFAGQREGVWNIYWVSRSTKEQKQLTHYSKFNAFVRYPAWSPSGNQIVYEYAETTGNVWVMEMK